MDGVRQGGVCENCVSTTTSVIRLGSSTDACLQQYGIAWPDLSPHRPGGCSSMRRGAVNLTLPICGVTGMSSTTALIVIDVQKSFEKRPYWSDSEVPAFRRNLTQLIESASARNIPIVRILHREASGDFSLESGLVRPLDWLPAAHDVEFVKTVHNAFTDTGLDRWLRSRGIHRLIISGIRTEQCCETTTRVAADLGYSVDFVTDATLTFAMTHAGSGRCYDSADIKARTELVLADRFARICSVEEALEAA
jgi:nicotinamidase-related amidase